MSLPRLTRAAVLYSPLEPIQIEELELPELLPGQVLVKMAYSGVCQTQLLEVRGRKGPDAFLPHCLGHEGSGTVVSVGEGVSRVRADDTVVLSWIKGPGMNAPGPQYKLKRNGQKINAGPVATFSEFAVVSENRCTHLDSPLPMKTLSLLGCAVPTGAGMVLHQLKARPGQSIAIIGVGGIGLSAVLAAKLVHCNPIIAIDIAEAKLQFAKELGATHAVQALREDATAIVRQITRGGADFAIEASGQRSAMESGYRMIRDQGGIFLIAGNLTHGQHIEIDPFDLIKGRNLLGTAGGETATEKDFPLYAKLCSEGYFPFEKLATQIYRLEEINTLMDQFEKGFIGGVGRLMIQFS